MRGEIVRFLTGSLRRSAVFAALCLFPVVAAEAATILTLGHIYPADHPRAVAAQRFADEVRRQSRGRVEIRVLGESASGSQAAMLRGLQNGSLDAMINSLGAVASLVPEMYAFSLPYLFADEAALWRVLDGEIGRQLVRKAEAQGLHLLGFLGVEARNISNSIRPITKPADMAGMRIRLPPDAIAVEIVAALGAKPQEVNFSDLYRALQMRVVDGQDNSFISFRYSRLYEVQKFYSLTRHKFAVHGFWVSRLAWNGLSPADRKIVAGVAAEISRMQRDSDRAIEDEAQRELLARGVRINKVDVRPFAAATATIYDRWYAGPTGDFVRSVVHAAREP